jgi:glycosyltransferase involved in cell wall biosynthesis
MNIHEALRQAGVTPWSRENAISYEILAPAGDYAAELRPDRPMVSCLMVTRGDTELLRYAVDSFARQTWRNRELIVVTNSGHGEAIKALLFARGIEAASIFVVSADLSLGDLRNIGAARAKGQILMPWDDDDLSDPQRIETCVAVLMRTGAAAAFLSRLLLWWPERECAAITYRRYWEGSMAVWREHARVTPALPYGEDTPVMEAIIGAHPIASIDAPLLYVYVVSGANTSHVDRFQSYYATAERRFEGEAYHQLVALLSGRMPILEYDAYLRQRRQAGR